MHVTRFAPVSCRHEIWVEQCRASVGGNYFLSDVTSLSLTPRRSIRWGAVTTGSSHYRFHTLQGCNFLGTTLPAWFSKITSLSPNILGWIPSSSSRPLHPLGQCEQMTLFALQLQSSIIMGKKHCLASGNGWRITSLPPFCFSSCCSPLRSLLSSSAELAATVRSLFYFLLLCIFFQVPLCCI